MPSVPADQNPAVVIGAVLGVAASQFGRDKVTIVISPRISSLGAWLEQLLAESTGKDGRGLIPIDGEPLASPRLAQRGDLVSVDSGSGAAMAVCLGSQIACVTLDGMVFLPISCALQAWKV